MVFLREMFNKDKKNKRGGCKIGKKCDENVVDYEYICKERIAKNEEYLSSLGLANK